MSLRVDYSVLNQRETPSLFADVFSNRPAFGFNGRLFISIDTKQIFRDYGTNWELIADAGSGSSNLQQVCTNGNFTTTDIDMLSGNLILRNLNPGGVLFTNTSEIVSQDINNFFWDDTNNRLGIGTNTPTAPLDVHSTGNILQQLNGTSTNNTYLAFLNQDIGKWRIGNYYNSGDNDFVIYDTFSGVTRAFFTNTGYTILPTNLIIGSSNRSSAYGMDVYVSANYQGTLRVQGATTLLSQINGTFAVFSGDLTIATNKFFVNSSTGNIGMGTITPEANSNNTTLQIDGTNSSFVRTGTSAYGGYFATIPTADVLVLSNVRNPVTGTFSNINKACSQISLWGASGDGYITFSTSPTNNGSPVQRMTITKDGNVSIGINSPLGGSFVHIYKANGTSYTSNVQLRVSGGGVNNNRAQILFSDDALSDGKISYYPAVGSASFFSISARSTESDFIIQGSGNVMVGTTTDNGDRFQVSGATSLSTNLGVGRGSESGVRLSISSATNAADGYACIMRQQSGQDLFVVRNDGLIQTGTRSASPYNNTSAQIPNLYVSAGGTLERGTASSGRFKENILEWNGNGLATILALQPKTFKYKKEYYNKADIEFLGLIAEEVALVSPYLADFENEDRTGQVENVRYATIVVPLIKAIQELNEKLVRNNIN